MGHWEKKRSYKRLFDSEELTREKYLNAVRNGLLSYFSDALDYCLWDCMKGEVYKINVDTRGELLAHILEAAPGIKKMQSGTHTKKKKKKRHLCTRIAKLH